MRQSLSIWLRANLPESKKEKPLPCLPLQRRHDITRSPSPESLNLSALSSTAESAFFCYLPFEVRRMILVEAFGNRVIHMDLHLDHPTLCRKPGKGISHYHADVAPTIPDALKPKEWQWWSSVCHRAPPTIEFPTEMKACTELFADACREGSGFWCDSWPGLEPSNCHIGVMGWLLSCRQA